MTEPAQTCAACAHFDAHKSDLAHLGFGKCDQLPAWRHLSGQALCAFNPSRWSPRRDAEPTPEIARAD